MTLDINTATSDQLKQWRDGQNWDDAPQGAKDQLDAIIAQRYTDESVAAAMGNYRRKEVGRKNDEHALRDWPELNNKDSDMYKAVTAEMESDPNALEDPNAFANAARKVGLGMGLTPVGFTPTKSGGGDMDTIGGGDGVAGREGVEPGVEFLEATKDIAKTFGGMLDMNDPKVRAEIAARVEGDK